MAEPQQVVIFGLADRSERVLPVSGGTIRTLAWTAKDAGIAYLADGPASNAYPEARLIDLSSGTDTRLELPSQDASITSDAASLIVSPDGTRLAWIEQDRRCDNAGCDSNFPERFAMFDASGVHAFDPGSTTGSSMHWSPAGDQLLFTSIDGITAVPVQGGPPRSMASGSALNLEWSVDQVTWQPLFR